MSDSLPPDITTRKKRYRLPRRPTKHLPGSPGKVECMARRLERGEHLHHPRDARLPDDAHFDPLAPVGELALAPILHEGNHKLDTVQIVDEREYRRQERREEFWGVEGVPEDERPIPLSEICDIGDGKRRERARHPWDHFADDFLDDDYED